MARVGLGATLGPVAVGADSAGCARGCGVSLTRQQDGSGTLATWQAEWASPALRPPGCPTEQQVSPEPPPGITHADSGTGLRVASPRASANVHVRRSTISIYCTAATTLSRARSALFSMGCNPARSPSRKHPGHLPHFTGRKPPNLKALAPESSAAFFHSAMAYTSFFSLRSRP